MHTVIAVALGGAVGAVARYFTMSAIGAWLGSGFPWGTFVCNLLGSFILGVILETSALVWSPPAELRAFLVVGMMGAFTTFSTFSMDSYYLIERGQVGPAAAYVAGSVVLCIIGFWAAIALLRHLHA